MNIHTISLYAKTFVWNVMCTYIHDINVLATSIQNWISNHKRAQLKRPGIASSDVPSTSGSGPLKKGRF